MATDDSFRRCFELGLIGMAITSPTAGFLDVNDRLCEMLGYERSELLQMTWAQLTHPDDLAASLAQFDRILAGEIEAYTTDKRYIRKDGQIIDATISAKCLRRSDGTADSFVALLQDITGRKRAEEELDRRVVERTRQLTAANEELRKEIAERKRAEEALRATGEQLRALSASLNSAREEEGARIARKLHDELGSALTSLKWGLEDLEKPGSLPLRDKVASLVGLIETTIHSVKRISSELRPRILDNLGLAAAIEWQAQQFEGRTGITCKFDAVADSDGLSEEHATAIFRIVQEALTNVLRHAQATRVNIVMEEEEREIVLEVRDNGRGIREEERTASPSLGLIGMRERAHLIGGIIEISGAAGKGTVLRLRVPIPEQGAG